MNPVVILIDEHKIILKMIGVLKSCKNNFPPNLVDVTVDFFRTYADKCHHGKEEDILFRRLEKKVLKPEEERILKELIEEHKLSRKLVGEFAKGQNLSEIIDKITTLYEMHIDKENRHFFLPAFGYFSEIEKREILDEFLNCDRQLIDEKYLKVVLDLEKRC